MTCGGGTINGLLPATTNLCTSGKTLTVPLRGSRFRRASKRVAITTRSAVGFDVDRVRLTCVPHGWPMHGYDHANTRANLQETILGPGNAASLTVKWTLDLPTLGDAGLNSVTSTPTVGNGLVYVTSWGGFVYAVRPSNGTVTMSAPTSGPYSGVLFFGDRSGTGLNKFNGTATSKMTGAIYFASQDVQYNGNFSGINGCTQVVGKTIAWTGNTSVSVDCAAQGMRTLPVLSIVRLTA